MIQVKYKFFLIIIILILMPQVSADVITDSKQISGKILEFSGSNEIIIIEGRYASKIEKLKNLVEELKHGENDSDKESSGPDCSTG